MNNWEFILDEIERSGQSIAEYCRSHGIKPHTVRYWKQKRKRQTNPSGFISIKPSANTPSAMEIIYPNGVRLKLQTGFSIQDLKSLLDV